MYEDSTYLPTVYEGCTVQHTPLNPLFVPLAAATNKGAAAFAYKMLGTNHIGQRSVSCHCTHYRYPSYSNCVA